MTSRIHRLARALSVAGGVSLSTLALAGTPELSPPAQVTTTATQGQLRQEAMKVEMALLGDPSTVNNPVTVAIENNCIKVKGTVADEATRQRILQVARQSCYLPVQAELGCSQLTGQLDSKQLKTQARSALIRQLGAGAGRLNVQVNAGGDIKLEGEVATIEEKSHASRAIREVSGTARIVNCIKVSGAANGGQSITLVSCNGPDVTCSKPSPVVQASGVTPRSDNIAKVSPSEEISPPLPKFQTTLPSGLPQPRIVKVTSETGDKKGRPVMYIPPPADYTQGAGKTPAAKVIPTSGTQAVNGTDKVVVQNEVSGKTRRSFWEKLTVFKKDRQAHCDACQTTEQVLRGGEATPVREQVVSAPNARPVQQPQVRVEPQTMETVLASQVSQPVVSYPAATPAVALPAQNPP
ncbi:MAG: BON domain-containing protein, partial [Gemmataceae bacterium]